MFCTEMFASDEFLIVLLFPLSIFLFKNHGTRVPEVFFPLLDYFTIHQWLLPFTSGFCWEGKNPSSWFVCLKFALQRKMPFFSFFVFLLFWRVRKVSYSLDENGTSWKCSLHTNIENFFELFSSKRNKNKIHGILF